MNERAKERWYGVSILFKSEHPGNIHEEWLWEEQVRIIQADSEGEAKALADFVGRENETSYQNIEGHEVKWSYQGILGICAIFSELSSGCEVFSRPLGNLEAASLAKPVVSE